MVDNVTAMIDAQKLDNLDMKDCITEFDRKFSLKASKQSLYEVETTMRNEFVGKKELRTVLDELESRYGNAFKEADSTA